MHVPELARRLFRPSLVLAMLVVAQWGATAVFAASVERNGWFFYQGGDQTWVYTTAWILSEGSLPATYVGYGWSLLLVPIAWLGGADYLTALPAIVLLQVVVFQPVALLCVYAIASRLAGRLAGYLTAIAWIVLPFAVIPLWDPRYHEKYVAQFLPQALGLTGLADYPSMVVLLVAAYLTLRALDTHALADAAAAGVAAGFAIGVKPANGLFVAAPLLALAVARRWRSGGAFAVALVPALATLALWKYRGLGQLPAFAFPEARLASGSVALLGPLEPYVPLDWNQLKANETQLREYFWSVRLLEWLPLAGAVGLARRSVPAAVLLGSWFVLFLVGKGASERAGVEVGTFFRLLMPAYPAFFLLGLGLLLLVPLLGGRLAALPRPSFRPLGPRVLAAALVAGAIVPMLAVAAVRASDEVRAVNVAAANTYIPVTAEFALRDEADGDGLRLTWARVEAPARVFYRVLRAPADDVRCEQRAHAPPYCRLDAEVVRPTRAASIVVDHPGRGRWTYRVGVAASWNDEVHEGDVLLLSEPLVVDGG